MDFLLIADMSGWLSLAWMIGSVAAGLGLVIFVHELGHFLAAKACGVKCEKFYIGFDIPLRLGPFKLPSTLGKFRWGETEYGIGILPLGGYVKMLGQDDNPAAQAKENERVKIQKSAGSTDPADADSGPSWQEDEAFELDPRSYPAKPVWQRMIIISAGVIMNLIFAVIFAAIAYGMGVIYKPCVIGGTAPGDPAWVAGLAAGDKILAVSRSDAEDEQLRFEKDLMIHVVLNGAHREMPLLIRRNGQSTAQWYAIQPSDRMKAFRRPATLGVRPSDTTQLQAGAPVVSSLADVSGYDQLRGGDEVIAVDGIPLPQDEALGVILAHHLERQLAQNISGPITLTVRRSTSPDPEASSAAVDSPAPLSEVQITLPPRRLRTLGLVMQAGPITGVRKGTPADEAGIRAGDQLTSINGQPLGDPMTLPERLLEWVGQEIEVQLNRDGKPKVFTVTPQPPPTYVHNFGPLTPIVLRSLGIAYQESNVVQSVEPGSPAADAGLAAGDVVSAVQFWDEEGKTGEPVPLVELQKDGTEKTLGNWSYVTSALQMSPDFQVELSYRRDGAEAGSEGAAEPTVKLAAVESDTWFYADRGLNTSPLSQIRTAQSFGEAWSLGYRETKTSLIQVVIVLQRLFTGQISVRNMGGPIMIAAAAGSEASKGLARLLTFLTFLSANLAVLNFLPIPALDGGHMLFLAAEGIRGKPVNERLQITLTLIGVACLLSLMVLVFANDIHTFVFSR